MQMDDNHLLDFDLATQPKPKPPSLLQIYYDIVMFFLIVVDLLAIGVDALLMSVFMTHMSHVLGFSSWVMIYQSDYHHWVKTLGGFFTIFLVVELLVRWGLAIYHKTHYRWFFFPFVHWYEVLGCSPQLRALRLLRAGVIVYRLYQIDRQVLPKSWIKSAVFYYELLLEEISDRVIVVAIDNIRTELRNTDGQLVKSIVDKHRADIEKVIVEILHLEVTPILIGQQQTAVFAEPLANKVGIAIQQAMLDTPELQRIVRLIPIAGGLIESQLSTIVQHIAENLTRYLSRDLTDKPSLDMMYRQIAKGIAQVDVQNPTLEKLVLNILEDSLTALEKQVKIQQWKHKAQVNF